MTSPFGVIEKTKEAGDRARRVVSRSKEDVASMAKHGPYDSLAIGAAYAGCVVSVAGVILNGSFSDPQNQGQVVGYSLAFVSGVWGGITSASAAARLFAYARRDAFEPRGNSSLPDKARILARAVGRNARESVYSSYTLPHKKFLAKEMLAEVVLFGGVAAGSFALTRDLGSVVPWIGISLAAGAEIFGDALRRIAYERRHDKRASDRKTWAAKLSEPV